MLTQNTGKDGDQTKYHPPTVLDKAVQSAKQTWGTLSLASIQNSLGSAASSLAERALAKVPSSRQPSIQDISGWEPPKNAFASPFGLQELHRHGVRRVHPPQTSGSPSPISREAKLQAYRAQLEEKKKQRPGPAFVQHEQEYDPLGDSVAWQRRAVRGGDEERKRMLLEEWRVKEERGERERPGRIRRHPRRDQEVGEGFRTGEEERGELARGGAKTLREAAFKDPDGRLETAAGMERNVAVMVTMPSVTKDQGHRVSRAARGGRNCLTRGKAALR